MSKSVGDNSDKKYSMLNESLDFDIPNTAEFKPNNASLRL